MSKSSKCSAILIVVLTIVFFDLAQSQPRHADLLLFNGKVITMNPAQPRAQAIAIQQGRIVWVGADEAGRKLFGRTIPKMDLHGSTVLPGLIDAHTHLFELGKSLLRLNLKDVKTEREMVEQVRKRVASAHPGEWILGWGWDEGKWAAAYPNNQALSREDQQTNQRPGTRKDTPRREDRGTNRNPAESSAAIAGSAHSTDDVGANEKGHWTCCPGMRPLWFDLCA
jgi:hypothetical protein